MNTTMGIYDVVDKGALHLLVKTVGDQQFPHLCDIQRYHHHNFLLGLFYKVWDIFCLAVC